MSSAGFLLSPEVQKLLQVLFSEPGKQLSTGALAKTTRLSVADVSQTVGHLIKSGILTLAETAGDGAETVSVDTSSVFYAELRRISLKSFAAAGPIRRMLRTKFMTAVMRAFILGEDGEANVELLVVHGEVVPDQVDMSVACRRLSAALGRHLTGHVISHDKYVSRTARDALGAKLCVQCLRGHRRRRHQGKRSDSTSGSPAKRPQKTSLVRQVTSAACMQNGAAHLPANCITG